MANGVLNNLLAEFQSLSDELVRLEQLVNTILLLNRDSAMRIARFTVYICLVSTLFACGGGGGDDAGDLRTDTCSTIGLSARIVNGTQCSDTNSAVVPIRISTRTNDFLCSGTMITGTYVLSAAHCFLFDADNNGSADQIISASITANGRQISASRVFVHPDYYETAEALFNDVAILNLDSPADLPIIPIVLSQAVSGGDVVQIFGYGSTGNTAGTGVLRSGEMRVTEVSENHLITQFNGSNGSNTCVGDSGGPAFLTLPDGSVGIVGITSSGVREDCGAGDTSLFSNVQGSRLLAFITSVVPGVPTI